MAPEGESAASVSLKKMKAAVLCLLGRGFSLSKCKTELKLAVARMKLLRNKREAQVRQMRRDIAMLLSSGQTSTARIRVEHVIREQNIMAANEIIELFCELMVSRLPIIAKQSVCPADLKEGISSLLFAGPRCSEIPELQRIRTMFEKKYGKDFVSAAIELRPNSGVNQMLIEKLSVKTPSGEVKMRTMKDIAKEFQVEWDSRETEEELLKPPEEKLIGPSSFVSASSMPVKHVIPCQDTPVDKNDCDYNSAHFKHESGDIKDSISTARAALELAEKAVAVAQAAANLTKQSPEEGNHDSVLEVQLPTYDTSCLSTTPSTEKGNVQKETNKDEITMAGNHVHMQNRRGSRSLSNSDIKFDDSDGMESDKDDETSYSSHPPPPDRPAPRLPPHDAAAANMDMNKPNLPSFQVHPKLPDYDSIAARFQALKIRRFS